MTPLSKIWARIREADGILSAHLSDLLILLGYLSVGIYSGGYQYIVSYNGFFALPVKPDPANLSTFIIFVENVLLSNSLFLTLVCMSILAFIIISNFVLRIVFRLWFAYMAVCLIAIFCIFSFIGLGGYYGKRHAEQDISAASKLPEIQIHTSGASCNSVVENRSGTRLLFRDASFIYFFETVNPQSGQVVIKSVSTSCVAGITLTRRE